MRATPWTKPVLLGALVLAAATGLALLARQAPVDLSDGVAPVAEAGGRAAEELGRAPAPAPPPELRVDAGALAARLESESQRILCLAAEDDEPLQGVHLFRDGYRVAGPSGEDGVLLVEESGSRRRTLWKPGRSARQLVGADLPATVRLEAAQAVIELGLQGFAPTDRLTRTRIALRGSTAPPTGPWTPRFQLDLPAGLRATSVAPGEYDLYVWVARDGGAPRPWVRRGVRVAADGVTRVEIDLEQERPGTREEDG